MKSSAEQASKKCSAGHTDNAVDADSDYPVPAKLQFAGKNGTWLTAGIIIADVVGAGILGMPAAVAQFGWLLGGVVMAVMLAANVHISILLWRVRMNCAACSDSRTYVSLCRGAFALAPKWQRRGMATITGVSQYLFLFGLMGVYLLSASKGLGMMLYQVEMCLPKWMMIACGLLVPFALTAREMGSYQSLVWLNIITLCGTVLIPLGYYSIVGSNDIVSPDSHWNAVSEMTPTGVLSGLSTFTFGMTTQFVLTEIIAEMKEPADLPKAYAQISAPFQFAAFTLAGLGGYYFLGDRVDHMINENLPFNIPFRIAAGCLVIHMLISYLIKGVLFCGALLKNINAEYSDPDDTRKRSFFAWAGIVLPVLVATFLLANSVPFFGDAVDLLGASFTPLSCWLIPIGLFIRYYVDAGENRPHVSEAEWMLMGCEVTLALVLMVFGTYASLQTIIGHWATYGYPFDCHCQGLWNTCSCSRDHIGMDLCHLMPTQ